MFSVMKEFFEIFPEEVCEFSSESLGITDLLLKVSPISRVSYRMLFIKVFRGQNPSRKIFKGPHLSSS